MSLIVRLPEDLARRVEELAAQRHQSPEEIAIEAIEAHVPARRNLGFVSLGRSTTGRRAAEDEQMLAEGFGR